MPEKINPFSSNLSRQAVLTLEPVPTSPGRAPISSPAFSQASLALHIEHALIARHTRAPAAPQISAQVDDLYAIETLAQYFAQPGIRPSGKALAAAGKSHLLLCSWIASELTLLL